VNKITQHVVPKGVNNWGVQRGGAVRASKIFSTQNKAISYGRKISKNQGAELIIHRSTGTIRSVDYYGGK
jgi:hypothetical protein